MRCRNDFLHLAPIITLFGTLLAGCGTSDESAANGGAAGSGGKGGSSSGGGSGGKTSGGGTAGESASGGGGTASGGVSGVNCTDGFNKPPTSLPGWSPALSESGEKTLTYDTAHSHDDQRGPLGFCPAGAQTGQKYLALVSARFETDQDPPTDQCVVDYTQPDPTFAQYGMCGSGGNHHIYVEVRDESGQRLSAGFEVFYGTTVESIPDQAKPANEFPMNYAIYGDGVYGARAVYQGLSSDAVTNMRMPFHHHVCFLLTFQVTTAK